jgi:hypothetical protein
MSSIGKERINLIALNCLKGEVSFSSLLQAKLNPKQAYVCREMLIG